MSDQLREAKLRTISSFIFKWCDPKPKFSGVHSMYLANLLLSDIETLDINDFEKWRAEEEVRENEKRLAYQYDSDAKVR